MKLLSGNAEHSPPQGDCVIGSHGAIDLPTSGSGASEWIVIRLVLLTALQLHPAEEITSKSLGTVAGQVLVRGGNQIVAAPSPLTHREGIPGKGKRADTGRGGGISGHGINQRADPGPARSKDVCPFESWSISWSLFSLGRVGRESLPFPS